MPVKRANLHFAAAYSVSEFERIREGLIPQSMDDKWFVFFENTWLYCHRRTGVCVYAVKFESSGSSAVTVESWVNRDPTQYAGSQTDYDRSLLGWLIDNLLLGRDTEFPVPALEFPEPLDVAPPQPSTPTTAVTPSSNLSHKARVVQVCRAGNIVEIQFRGAHTWTNGRDMSRRIKQTLDEHAPVPACVINLLDYDYRSGDEISALFDAFTDRTTTALRPTCIVATGTTYASLQPYFERFKILDTFRLRFVRTVDEALAWLLSELERGG